MKKENVNMCAYEMDHSEDEFLCSSLNEVLGPIAALVELSRLLAENNIKLSFQPLKLQWHATLQQASNPG